MAKQRDALKAGVFIVVCIALMLAIVVGIRGIRFLLQPVTTRTVVFSLADDVGGLRLGDDLRVGGYKVGEVRKIEVAHAGPAGKEPPRIVVTFTIPRSLLVRSDARIGIQQTVTGTSWLNFEYLGSAGSPELPVSQPLAGRPSAMNELFAAAPAIKEILTDLRSQTLPGVNDTIAKLGRTAESFKDTSAKAGELLTHVREQVDPVVQRYNKVADPAAQTMVHLRDLFGDIKADWRQLMANLNAISATFKTKIPALLDQLDGALVGARKTIDGINSSLGDVQASVVNIKELTGSARSVVAGNKTKLDEMVSSMKATADNLKFASAEIRHSPWRLLYKPKPGEIENLNIFDSARQFAEGANDLNDATATLRDALKDPQADNEQVRRLMGQVEESFAKFQQVEKKLWQSVRE